MAEGYSAEEKEIFFGDVSQLSVDLFVEGTFGAWAPIFNIWGIYRESADTGIGTKRDPRATAFGVHKEESAPSALFVSNIHAARHASSATGPNAFDYTIIITNEDFQGSLGGEFLVLPKSLLTSSEEVCKGTFILNVYMQGLRHDPFILPSCVEIGRNFVSINEQNASPGMYRGSEKSQLNLLRRKWSQSLLDNTMSGPNPPARVLVQEYPWVNLADGELCIHFNSTGRYDRWLLKFTVSGAVTKGAVEVTLDGIDMPWEPVEEGLGDRGFHEYYNEHGLSAGQHVLMLTSGKEQRPELSSILLYEFRNKPVSGFEMTVFSGHYTPLLSLGWISVAG